jgi:glycosyltransferase involved in cell wall biosynthesis
MVDRSSSRELHKKPFSEDILYKSDITLTIGIPVYNGDKTLFSTLASIFNQLGDLEDALKLEVLISDNASTDKTPEIINFYKEKFPHIVKCIRNEHNIGATQNIRKIIENASNEYVWFLGDDNLYEGALVYLAKVLYYAPEKPKALVVKSDVWDSTMSSAIHLRHIKENIITKDPKKFLKHSQESVFFWVVWF